MNTNQLASKKITMTTVKSFIKANAADLWINVTSRFDGMTDMCERQNGGFTKVLDLNGPHPEQTKGIRGAWFVGDSRDYLTYWNKGGFEGIEVYNSCGNFVLAIKTA